MSINITKKFVHRALVGLAMLSPVVYLFGSMFFGLAGAHGEQIYAQESIVDVTPTYEDLMTPESFRYDAFNWDNEHGERLGFSLGYLHAYLEDDISITFTAHGASVTYNTYSSQGGNQGLGYANGDVEHTITLNIYGDTSTNAYYIDPEGSLGITQSTYVGFYYYDVLDGFVYAYIYQIDDHMVSGTYCYQHNPTSTGTWREAEGYMELDANIYFDDGAHLPEGVKWDANLASYFVPTVKSREAVTEDYTTGIFGNFFPKHNIVEKIGRNAVGQEPIGFTPFAAMLRYIDVNMLHAGNSQVGLMLYGMVYWCLHIVLADVVYHVLVFLPNLIMAVTKFFGRGIDDD